MRIEKGSRISTKRQKPPFPCITGHAAIIMGRHGGQHRSITTNDTAQQSGLPARLPSAAHCAHQINARNPAARQQGNHVFTRL